MTPATFLSLTHDLLAIIVILLLSYKADIKSETSVKMTYACSACLHLNRTHYVLALVRLLKIRGAGQEDIGNFIYKI